MSTNEPPEVYFARQVIHLSDHIRNKERTMTAPDDHTRQKLDEAKRLLAQAINKGQP